MKKIVALLLAFVMVFALCACGAKEEAPAAVEEEVAAPAEEAAAPFKAGFIFLHDENSTYDLNFLNATKEACEALGVEYITKVNIPESEACYDAAWNWLMKAAPTSSLTPSATSPTCSRLQRKLPKFSSAMLPVLRLTPLVLPTTTTLLPASMKAASSVALLQA